ALMLITCSRHSKHTHFHIRMYLALTCIYELCLSFLYSLGSVHLYLSVFKYAESSPEMCTNAQVILSVILSSTVGTLSHNHKHTHTHTHTPNSHTHTHTHTHTHSNTNTNTHIPNMHTHTHTHC